MRLSDNQVTEAIYRVCIKGESIKVVAIDFGVDVNTISYWASKYESRQDHFPQAAKDVGLTQADITRLTGRRRCTVWRWFTGASPVPDYVWTIVRQQQYIHQLVNGAFGDLPSQT